MTELNWKTIIVLPLMLLLLTGCLTTDPVESNGGLPGLLEKSLVENNIQAFLVYQNEELQWSYI
ncbi:MAG: hypothetical protein KAR21_12385 [Spirochaetales bacterium]|nr:hypothetical protein [Spirochaetales bacterium]